MVIKNQDSFDLKLRKIISFSISKALIEHAKSDLIELETFQKNYNISEEDFNLSRKRILDQTNEISRNLIELVEKIF